MKKIFFGKGTSNHIPFWNPWGIWGCLWRLLLFILLLLLLLFLLSMFRGCNTTGHRDSPRIVDVPEEFDRPGERYEQPSDQSRPIIHPIDSTWNRPIDGGEEVGLPSPEENQLPPFEEIEPIPNPEDGGISEIYPNLLYVIFNSEANDETFKKFAQKFTSLYPEPQHKISYYNVGSKTAVIQVPQEKRDEICEKLPQQITEINFYVVPIEVMTEVAATPNDRAFSYPDLSWQFAPIQANEAWEITQGSEDIIVGIVDSYMDLNHEELAGGRCVHPYSIKYKNSNVAPENGMPMDLAGHGTFVTAVAVGNANNNKGSAGIAPKCKYIPVSLGNYMNTMTMTEGLLYCIYKGANVINLSMGLNMENLRGQLSIEQQLQLAQESSKAQEQMWNYVFKLAEEKNVTIVWAAGNDNLFAGIDASKRGKNTIVVSSVDKRLKKSDFSNFGNFRDKNIFVSTISAPGSNIFGALPNNKYDVWDGTSFSAPIITGVVALMKSVNKNLKTADIIKILQETGRPINDRIGNMVQIKDAVLKAKNYTSSQPTPSPEARNNTSNPNQGRARTNVPNR